MGDGRVPAPPAGGCCRREDVSRARSRVRLAAGPTRQGGLLTSTAKRRRYQGEREGRARCASGRRLFVDTPHNPKHNVAAMVRDVIERIERLETEKKALNEDIKHASQEGARNTGWPAKALTD